MRLVYKETRLPVLIGDTVKVRDATVVVQHYAPPRSPASSGRVTVAYPRSGNTAEYYVGVIGAEWIEREDREDCDSSCGP